MANARKRTAKQFTTVALKSGNAGLKAYDGQDFTITSIEDAGEIEINGNKVAMLSLDTDLGEIRCGHGALANSVFGADDARVPITDGELNIALPISASPMARTDYPESRMLSFYEAEVADFTKK